MSKYPSFCRQFVPMGPHLLEGRHKPPPAGHKDPERTPSRELARDLGRYGSDLLGKRIRVEFTRQVRGGEGDNPIPGPWKAHIRKIVDDYQFALDKYSDALAANKRWMDQQAELAALCFSLIALPVIRWAGAFVEHRVSHAFLRKTQIVKKGVKTTSISVLDASGLMDIKNTVNFTSSHRVNELTAQFFGGISEDILGGITEKIMKNDATKQVEPFSGIVIPDHKASAVTVTRNLLDGALGAGTGTVIDRIDDAVSWMALEPDFGDAWARASGGNKTLAMDKILQHFTGLRDRWAKSSLYFGQNPASLPPTLARQFERMLWAAYIDGVCGHVLKSNGLKRETIYAPDWPVGKNDHPDPKAGWTGEAGRRVILMERILSEVAFGSPIINRLKELNIVFAETKDERDAQGASQKVEERWNKEDDMGPDLHQEKPTLDVKGSVDRLNELRALWNWARQHSKDRSNSVLVPGNQKGVPRALRPLSSSAE